MSFSSTFADAIHNYTGLSPVAFFTILALMISAYHIVCSFFVPPSAASDAKPLPRVTELDTAPREPVNVGEITLEELRMYDGSDPKKPLLMAIKGNIFDVSLSRNFYGPGGPYALFAGRDATRALALMSFDPNDLTSSTEGLDSAELEVLHDWELKFMEKYPKVGKVLTEDQIAEETKSLCTNDITEDESKDNEKAPGLYSDASEQIKEVESIDDRRPIPVDGKEQYPKGKTEDESKDDEKAPGLYSDANEQIKDVENIYDMTLIPVDGKEQYPKGNTEYKSKDDEKAPVSLYPNEQIKNVENIDDVRLVPADGKEQYPKNNTEDERKVDQKAPVGLYPDANEQIKDVENIDDVRPVLADGKEQYPKNNTEDERKVDQKAPVCLYPDANEQIKDVQNIDDVRSVPVDVMEQYTADGKEQYPKNNTEDERKVDQKAPVCLYPDANEQIKDVENIDDVRSVSVDDVKEQYPKGQEALK